MVIVVEVKICTADRLQKPRRSFTCAIGSPWLRMRKAAKQQTGIGQFARQKRLRLAAEDIPTSMGLSFTYASS